MNFLLLKATLLLYVASLPFGKSEFDVTESRHVESYRQYRNESRWVCVTRSQSRCFRRLFHEKCEDVYYCEYQLRYDVQYSTANRCQSGWKTYPDCNIPICSNCTAGTRCTAPDTCTELSREPPSRRLLPVITVTETELHKISEKIWESDGNRVKDSDVQYSIQGPQLFGKVNSAAFAKKPTFDKMIKLFGLYDGFNGPDITKTEDDFLKEILKTEPIKKAYNWLSEKGLTSSKTLMEFKKELHQYWFARYTRPGGQQGGSCGFIHTFAGEIYGDRAAGPVLHGLHNWVRMYLAEIKGIFTYRGHERGCKPAIESIEFDWRPINSQRTFRKDVSSLFIRTSPEVEIALYTVCLLARPNVDCPIRLKSNNKLLPIAISTRNIASLKYITINSAFPICT